MYERVKVLITIQRFGIIIKHLFVNEYTKTKKTPIKIVHNTVIQMIKLRYQVNTILLENCK